MVFNYSKNLIDRLIAYFSKVHGVVLTPEQANEYLDSYAGLFLAFADDYESKAIATKG